MPVHCSARATFVRSQNTRLQVCLADWGISVPVSESSRSMHATGSQVRAPAAVGTEFWCAPEIERVGWLSCRRCCVAVDDEHKRVSGNE
eukprot:1157517-Pelagomonas_calceolata.AAC.5